MNPLLRKELQICFRKPEQLVIYLNYLIFLAVVTFISWPKTRYLQADSKPLTFEAVTVSMLVAVAYLSFRLGVQDLALENSPTPLHWLRDSSLGIRRLIQGYLSITIIHSAFLVTLPLPFILSALSLSGITFTSALWVLLFILLVAMAYRIWGFICLTFWPTREFLTYWLTRMLFLFFIALSGVTVPVLNPIIPLLNLNNSSSPLPDPMKLGIIIYLIMILAGTIILTLSFQLIRRKKYHGAS